MQCWANIPPTISFTSCRPADTPVSDYFVRTSGDTDWNENTWDAFVERHPFSHPLQLSAWGRFKELFGWQSERLGLFQYGELIAGAQILYRTLPGVPLKFAYIPKGPLFDKYKIEKRRLFDAIHQRARRRGAVMLRIEPELIDSDAHRFDLMKYGFSSAPHAIQPQTTVWIDLKPDEDEILARMKQKWRYNIRLAGRKGVTVRTGDAQDVDRFIELMQVTGQRKEFGVHAPEYYRAFWRLFAPAGHAELLVAEFEGEMLAGIMVALLGKNAYYFYGASGNRHRNLMPSHLLQWEAMRRAKARGCTAYDLWGVPDEVGVNPDAPIPDPPEGMWGVWRFKRGFGGEIVRYVGAWDKGYYPGVLTLAHRLGY